MRKASAGADDRRDAAAGRFHATLSHPKKVLAGVPRFTGEMSGLDSTALEKALELRDTHMQYVPQICADIDHKTAILPFERRGVMPRANEYHFVVVGTAITEKLETLGL